MEESNSGNLVKQEGEGLLTKLTLPSLCVSVAHGYRCRWNWSSEPLQVGDPLAFHGLHVSPDTHMEEHQDKL